jgi:hypothetical protein
MRYGGHGRRCMYSSVREVDQCFVSSAVPICNIKGPAHRSAVKPLELPNAVRLRPRPGWTRHPPHPSLPGRNINRCLQPNTSLAQHVHSKSELRSLRLMGNVADMQASYDPRRVFRFSLPDIQVGPKTRAVGTYISGGLVSCRTGAPLPFPRQSSLHTFSPGHSWALRLCCLSFGCRHALTPVRPLLLPPLRRRNTLQARQAARGCAVRYHSRARLLCRLGPGDMLHSWVLSSGFTLKPSYSTYVGPPPPLRSHHAVGLANM